MPGATACKPARRSIARARRWRSRAFCCASMADTPVSNLGRCLAIHRSKSMTAHFEKSALCPCSIKLSPVPQPMPRRDGMASRGGRTWQCHEVMRRSRISRKSTPKTAWRRFLMPKSRRRPRSQPSFVRGLSAILTCACVWISTKCRASKNLSIGGKTCPSPCVDASTGSRIRFRMTRHLGSACKKHALVLSPAIVRWNRCVTAMTFGPSGNLLGKHNRFMLRTDR